MRLVVWEWRKLFHLPALWVFVGLYLVLNGLLLSSPSAIDRAFFHDTSADAAALGQRVDEDFLAGLDAPAGHGEPGAAAPVGCGAGEHPGGLRHPGADELLSEHHGGGQLGPELDGLEI